jgi:hypothetical protein
MNVLLIQTISAWGWLTLLAARNSGEDDTIWVQMLVIVILAVFLGIFGLARAKADKSKEEDQLASGRSHGSQSRQSWAKPSAVRHSQAHLAEPAGKIFKDLPRKRGKDLQSGMELLGLDFLLKVVENTNDGSDEKDVTMRKLNFKELQRRGKLNQADSNALKVYAVNKSNLYGKDIQCEAMKSLAERTTKGGTGK